MRKPGRNPLIRTGLIVVTVALGLASRRLGHRLPALVADYAGDTLLAIVIFLGLGLTFRRAST